MDGLFDFDESVVGKGGPLEAVDLSSGRVSVGLGVVPSTLSASGVPVVAITSDDVFVSTSGSLLSSKGSSSK